MPVRGVVLSDLQELGWYKRETLYSDGRLFDAISEHPMSTEFAISRFLVPRLADRMHYTMTNRWALFMDCDVLVRRSLDDLFKLANPKYAVMVVKHDFRPTQATKMDGQVQSQYNRKNWSSVMLFNVDHPSNANLTDELINGAPGRDLHAFCWLQDDEIGELDVKWNYLVGHHTPEIEPDPAIVHFTDGIPTMPGYENCEFADEWRSELVRWAK